MKKRRAILIMIFLSVLVGIVGITISRNRIRARYYFSQLTNSSLTEEQRIQSAEKLFDIGKAAKPYLLQGLEAEEIFVRKEAIKILLDWHFMPQIKIELDSDSIERIVTQLQKEKDPKIRGYGLLVIEKAILTDSDIKGVDSLLEDSLTHSSPYVRGTAVRAFTKIKFDNPYVVVPQLIKMLEDPEINDYAKRYLNLYTGKNSDNFGKNVSEWEKWWSQNKDTFEPYKY